MKVSVTYELIESSKRSLTFHQAVSSDQEMVSVEVLLLVDFDGSGIGENDGRIEFAGVRSLLDVGQTKRPVVLQHIDLQLLLASIQNELDTIAILYAISEVGHKQLFVVVQVVMEEGLRDAIVMK